MSVIVEQYPLTGNVHLAENPECSVKCDHGVKHGSCHHWGMWCIYKTTMRPWFGRKETMWAHRDFLFKFISAHYIWGGANTPVLLWSAEICHSMFMRHVSSRKIFHKIVPQLKDAKWCSPRNFPALSSLINDRFLNIKTQNTMRHWSVNTAGWCVINTPTVVRDGLCKHKIRCAPAKLIMLLIP